MEEKNKGKAEFVVEGFGGSVLGPFPRGCWIRASGIVVIAWLVLFVLVFLLVALVGVGIPKFDPF